MKIAIIGMGVARISVLREWTKERKFNSSIQLAIFNNKNTFQPDAPCLLMKQGAKFTSIDSENDDESFTFKLEDAELQIDYVINATGNNRHVSHDMKQDKRHSSVS